PEQSGQGISAGVDCVGALAVAEAAPADFAVAPALAGSRCTMIRARPWQRAHATRPGPLQTSQVSTRVEPGSVTVPPCSSTKPFGCGSATLQRSCSFSIRTAWVL